MIVVVIDTNKQKNLKWLLREGESFLHNSILRHGTFFVFVYNVLNMKDLKFCA